MRLWIIALAISAMSSCGQQNEPDNSSSSSSSLNNQTSPEPATQQVSQPMPGAPVIDSYANLIDTGTVRRTTDANGKPIGPDVKNKKDAEKPKPRPKVVPVTIDP